MENRAMVARGGRGGQGQRVWENALGSVTRSTLIAAVDTELYIELQAKGLLRLSGRALYGSL